jgi:hypothetical protein
MTMILGIYKINLIKSQATDTSPLSQKQINYDVTY